MALYQRILMTGWKCQILRIPATWPNFIDFGIDLRFFMDFVKFPKFDPLSQESLKTTNYAQFEAVIFWDASLDMVLLIRESPTPMPWT